MTMQPIFLSLARVIDIHQNSIETYGGSPGVRDMGLLQSAISQPQMQFSGAYLHDGLAAMAGAYLYHLVKNHPFVDGNKRTGAMAAFIFLDLNDIELTATEEEYTELVLSVAAGNADKNQVIAFFRGHIR